MTTLYEPQSIDVLPAQLRRCSSRDTPFADAHCHTPLPPAREQTRWAWGILLSEVFTDDSAGSLNSFSITFKIQMVTKSNKEKLSVIMRRDTSRGQRWSEGRVCKYISLLKNLVLTCFFSKLHNIYVTNTDNNNIYLKSVLNLKRSKRKKNDYNDFQSIGESKSSHI